MGVRYVIAGESQCDLFAEICLVADYLAQRLPDFCYERIEKPVAEWKPWLQKINQKNKWHHTGSPIVWKELLMAGSKPFYIGYASEFLEYCEWLYKNKKLMENIASNINATASPKLYVVLPNLGPACYNATIIANSITKINKNNIVVVTSDIGLEMASVAAEIAEVSLRNMFCPPVWGFVGINHLVDIRTTIHKYDSFNPFERYTKVKNSTLCIGTITPEMRTMEYLMFFDETLWNKVADRKAKKKMSERPISIVKAVALLNLIKIWLFDPNPSYVVNLGIQCNGSFGLTFKGVFSQPAHLVNGEWRPASNYMLPKDPQVKIQYLQQIAEIAMKLKKSDLKQVVTYTPCVCKHK
ncbi:putative malate dehydrogenase 1B [Vanessa atalanta]|uniref:putative malate dehydrogenase 1B n=1 Tax=Vanessa atalanta TaxID=42275 RepID=UPI001FCD5951|nr:putative malate dehydrogenase 1B [Vanessa atalanta]